MSVDAISWAFRQEIKPSSLKFVLVALADNANHDGTAWPSLKEIERKTCQDRKTIIAALDKLESLGFIADTGERKGETGQVKVYRFNSTENGTVPKTEQYRNSVETVPFFLETVPKTVHGTIRTINEPFNKRSSKTEKKKQTAAPKDFEVTEDMFDWAVAQGLPETRVRLETENFIDRNRAKGATYSDWNAAWRTWVRNAVKFARAA